MKQKTCVQCGEELKEFETSINSFDKVIVYACTNPKCPNYGLLSIPTEQMPEEKTNVLN